MVVLFGLPLSGVAAGFPTRWFPWREGLAPPLLFRCGSGALPYPGRGGPVTTRGEEVFVQEAQYYTW